VNIKIPDEVQYIIATLETATQLILYHDADIQPHRKHIKRWLNKVGEESFRQLLEVKRADNKAQAITRTQEKLEMLDNIEILLDEIIAQKQCFSLKDLAVNGGDLIAAGIPEGVKIGVVLNQLMDMVIDEQVENDKTKLLKDIKKHL